MYKIGIDLSTTNTGIVVLNEDNKLIAKYDLLFRTFGEQNHKYNFAMIESICLELHNYFILDKCLVGIEISSHGDFKLVGRFNLYAGGFISNLVKYDSVEIKCFNAKQWQKLIGIGNNDTREMTKPKARQFVKEHCIEYNENWSEDICDAYCIAYNLENIKSSEQVAIDKKIKKSEDYLRKKKQKKINNKIKDKIEKIKKLDKKRNKRLINRLYQEIEILRRQL